MKEYWQNLPLSKKIRIIFIVLVSIIALIFVIRNWQPVEIIFVFFKLQVPLTLIILISGLIGFAIGSLFDYKKFKQRDNEIKRLTQKLNEKEEASRVDV